MFYDRFKLLCGQKGVSCNKAVTDMGLSNSTPTKWKKTGATPDSKTLSLVSEYFDVSISYLLTGAETEKEPALTVKDERDIARSVEKIMDDLASNGDLMFDGVPMSDEAKAAMAAAIRVGLEEAKRRNKETYTPKKYRKE